MCFTRCETETNHSQADEFHWLLPVFSEGRKTTTHKLYHPPKAAKVPTYLILVRKCWCPHVSTDMKRKRNKKVQHNV